jgi:hypothetical protein
MVAEIFLESKSKTLILLASDLHTKVCEKDVTKKD